MDAQYGPGCFGGFWNRASPALGHTDTDGTSARHVPAIGLVVAGDAVYGDVHLYLGEAKGCVNRGVLWNSAKSFMS
jgi:hypothetical protein